MGEVELDIFSGRPNPRWELSARQAEEFVGLVRHLVEIPSVPDRPSLLGYRGLWVRIEDLGSVFIGGGTLTRGSSTFRDPGHRLERWILETGRERLSPALWRLVAKQLE